MKIMLFFWLLLGCFVQLHAGLIISEVVLTSDGNFAALPYRSTKNLAESGGKRTVVVNPVIELTNTDSSAVDIQGYSLAFVIQTKVATYPHPGYPDYDLAGLQPNPSAPLDASVVLNTIRVGMCTNRRTGDFSTYDGKQTFPISPGAVTVIYTNPILTESFETGAYPSSNIDTYGDGYGGQICRYDLSGSENDKYIGFSLGVPKGSKPNIPAPPQAFGRKSHSFPQTVFDYPTLHNTTEKDYYRIYLSRLDGGPVSNLVPTLAWDGMMKSRSGGQDMVFSDSLTKYIKSSVDTAGLYGDTGFVRIPIGNKFIPSTETWQGEEVESHRFAILLLNPDGKVADVFYMGEGAGWAELDAYINANLAPGYAGFNSGGQNLTMFDKTDLSGFGLGYTSLHMVSYNKTSLNAADKPAAYVKSRSDIGSDETGPIDPDEIPGTDVIGPIFVRCLRDPPVFKSTTIITPMPADDIGDQYSTFQIEVSAQTGTGTPVDSVQIRWRFESTEPFPGGFFNLTKDPADPFLFTGTFIPKESGSLGSGEFDWDIQVKSMTNATNTTKEFSDKFKTKNEGPFIGNATFVPTIAVGDGVTSLTKGEAISLSVQAEDIGTYVLEYVYAVLYDATSGDVKVDGYEEIPMTTTDNTTYKVTLPLPTSLNSSNLYYWAFLAKDPWNGPVEKRFDTRKFRLAIKPYLDSSLPVINVLINETVALELREYTFVDPPYDKDNVTYSFVSRTANLSNCTLRAGAGKMHYIDVYAGSVAGEASCTIELKVSTPTPEVSNKQTILVNIMPDRDTIINSFRLAPSPYAVAPTSFQTWTNISFSDYLEVEAKLFDIDGLNGAASSVTMAFVVTDPSLTGGLDEFVAYEVLLFDDGSDSRSPKTAPFGQYKLSAPPPYTYPKLTALDKNIATPSGKFARPYNLAAAADFYTFKADLNGSLNDGLFHVTVNPYNFQYATQFRLDLTVKDNNGSIKEFAGVGRVGIYSGPGYFNYGSCFINRPETSVPVDYEAFSVKYCECNAPDSVSERKCGADLSAEEHNELYWDIVDYDTDFYSDVILYESPSTANTEDIITFKLKPYACNDGSIGNGGWINLSITDARGVSVTTNNFFPTVTCVNNAPYYISASPAELSTTEDSAVSNWWVVPILNYANEYSTYGETLQSALTWTLYSASPAWRVTAISDVDIVGTNLRIKLFPDVYHSGTIREQIVLCVQDAQGLYPSNGTVAGPSSINNACIIQSIHVLGADDDLLISKNGTSDLLPIGLQVGMEDTAHTTTVGIYDIDGPFGAANVSWSYTIKSDPSGVINNINFSYSSAVTGDEGSQIGERWNMSMTPNADKNGIAEVLVSVSNFAGVSASELVTYYIINTNDLPSFTAAPCSLISTNSGFPSSSTTPLTSVLQFSKVKDIDISNTDTSTTVLGLGNISPKDQLSWSLQRLQYSGFVLESVAGDDNMTAVGDDLTFSAVNTWQTIGSYTGSASSTGFVKIKVDGGPNSDGLISLESIPYAYGEATVVIQITDLAGAFDSYSCKLKINKANHPPVIDPKITDIIKNKQNIFAEDTTLIIDLGSYEKDPYNFGAFDKDLQWSVKLNTSTTLFDFPVDYPSPFAGFLNNKNSADGLDKLITLGNRGTSTKAGQVATPGDDPIKFESAIDDKLYIRAAPDMYGEFEIELNLTRLGLSPAPAPATKVLTFAITPVNDLPAITILNAAGTGEELAYTFTLSKTDSVAYLDLTSWENDARDFFGPVAGNRLTDNFYWHTESINSPDHTTYRLGCPSGGQKFLDATTNDILCIQPGTAVLYSSLDGDLELSALDKDSGVMIKKKIRVRVLGENTPPWAVGIGTGTDKLSFSESVSDYVYDLLPHSHDEEETANNSRKLLTWFFAASADLTTATTSLSLAGLGLGPDFATFKIDNTSTGSKLLVSSIPYMSGSTTVWMRLCDTGIPHGSEKRLCVSTSVTLEVTAINNSPSIEAIPISTLTTLAGSFDMELGGGCLSFPLQDYGFDPDDIYPNDPYRNVSQFPFNLTWEVKSGSVTLANQGLVAAPAIPVVTVMGSFGAQSLMVAFSIDTAADPFGNDNTCHKNSQNLGVSPIKAHDSVGFTLIVSDVWGLKAERSVTAVFNPRWSPPLITPSASFFVPDGSGNYGWSISEADPSTTISLELTAPANLIMLKDDDWGFGEDVDDFNWTLFSSDNALLSSDAVSDSFYSTNYLSWETEGFNCVLSSDLTWFATREFRLEIIRQGDGTSDLFRLSPYGHVHTTGVTVSLAVTDSQSLRNEVSLKIVVTDVNDSPIVAEINDLPVMEDGISNRNLVPFAHDPIDLDVIEWSFWNNNPLDCSLKNIDRTTFAATIANNVLSVSGKPNMFHTSSVPYGEVVTLCLKDRPGSADSIIISTEIRIYVYGLNDSPYIVLPSNANDWPGSVRGEIRHNEGGKTCFFVQGHDQTDTGHQNWQSYLSWQITPVSANYQVTVSENNSFICVESNAPYFHTTNKETFTLTLRDAGRWSSYDNSNKTSTAEFKVWTLPKNDPPVLSSKLDGSKELTLTYDEDVSGSITLSAYILIDDPDWGYGFPHDPGVYRWSFSDTNNNLTASLVNMENELSETRSLNLALVDNSFNCTVSCLPAAPQLKWTTTAEETNGFVDFSIYLHDLTDGAVAKPDFHINMNFRPIPDPPRFTSAAREPVLSSNGSDYYFKLKKNSAPLSVPIANWKEDPDTSLNKVCFSVDAYSTKLMVELPVPPSYQSPNCTTEKEILKITPVLGFVGEAKFTLGLADSSGNRVIKTFNVHVFDPQPRFDMAALSVENLTFQTSVAKVFSLSDLIIDDDELINANFSIAGASQSTSLYTSNCSVYKDCRVGEMSYDGAGELTIIPDYDKFSEGSVNFTLNYTDADGFLATVTATMVKEMSFLEWAKFDDVDGSGTRNEGDRILLKFSDSSEGVVGLTGTVPVSGSLNSVILSDKNIIQAIKPLENDAWQENGFGFVDGTPEAKKLDCFDMHYRPIACQDGAVYLQVTLNEYFISEFDEIGAYHDPNIAGIAGALVYKSGLVGYDRVVPISGSDGQKTADDDVSPRLLSAYLVDVNADGRYQKSDQIRLYFSEYIKTLRNSAAVDWILSYLNFSNVFLGTDYEVAQARNELRVIFGDEARILISNNPQVAGRSAIEDYAENILANADIFLPLWQHDDIGPWITDIKYDNRGGANYSASDRLYISFSESLRSDSRASLQNPLQLPDLFGLDANAFGSSGVEAVWLPSGALMITLGSNPAVNSSTNLVLSTSVRDIAGNPAGKNSVIADFGYRLPSQDNFPPYVELRYLKEGRLLTDNDLKYVGKGFLSIEAQFSTTPENTTTSPKITIKSKFKTSVSTKMSLFTAPNAETNTKYVHEFDIVGSDGLNFFDGAHTVTISAEIFDASGLDLGQAANNVFVIDTKPPSFTLAAYGVGEVGLQQKVVYDYVDIEGHTDEILSSFTANLISPSSGPVIVPSLEANKRNFKVKLRGLRAGENVIRIVGTDLAGNKTERIERIYYDSGDEIDLSFDPNDRDGDGVPNHLDAFPDDSSEWLDTDGDGIGDNADPDADGDRIPNPYDYVMFRGLKIDLSLDSDNDGIPNRFDLDADGDGLVDYDKLQDGHGYRESEIDYKLLDTNNNGIVNYLDNDIDGDGLTNLQEFERGTSLFNPDTDGDGVSDSQEINPLDPTCKGVNDECLGYLYYDMDSNDWDRDGIPNVMDRYPFDFANNGEPDVLSDDWDGDGKKNINDYIMVVSLTDYDGDGIRNEEDPHPCNALNNGTHDSKGEPIYNFNGERNIFLSLAFDFDNDCIPDYLDTDKNGSGIPDELEEMLEKNDTDTETRVAVPVDSNGKPLIRLPMGENEQEATLKEDVFYDFSRLGRIYEGVNAAKLPASPAIIEMVPIVTAYSKTSSHAAQSNPVGYSMVGEVISIRGKIKPEIAISFPFPLPSYFANNKTVWTHKNFKVQYYRESTEAGKSGWVDGGVPELLEGSVLYVRVNHFSDWRVLVGTAGVSPSIGAVAGGKAGGCFIVTAASGHPHHFLVRYFKSFRDQFLNHHAWGRSFMERYYQFSPVVAKVIAANAFLRWFVFGALCLLLPLSFLLWYWQWFALVFLFLVGGFVIVRRNIIRFIAKSS